MARAQPARSRYWLFTYNNPDVSGDELLQRFREHPQVLFVIFQLERGVNGTPHFQGYVGLRSQRSLGYVRAQFGQWHFEPRRGTHADGVGYCSKVDTRESGPWQFDVPEEAGQGTRTDIQRAVIALREGGIPRVVELCSEILVRYPRGIVMLSQYLPIPERPPCDYILCIGPTGTGKTRWAVESSNGDFYKHEPRSPWFDGYTGQSTLIIDEYSGWWSLDYLLSFCDRYPHRLQIKGQSGWLVSSRVIFTANVHPRTWYSYVGREEQYRALARRFTEVREYTGTGAIRVLHPTVGVGSIVVHDEFNTFWE